MKLQMTPVFTSRLVGADGINVAYANGAYTLTLTAVQGIVTPLQYGAVGDGLTDDTVAINRALATGLNVDLAGRTYKITAALTLAAGQSLRNGTLIKGFNGDMVDMSASYCRLENVRMLGVGATYAGRGVIVGSVSGSQQIVGCQIYDTLNYCIEFAAAGYGNQCRVTNCSYFRHDATLYAVKLPAAESSGNGLREFLDCNGEGGAGYDLAGSHFTKIVGGSSTGILWDTTTDGAIVEGHRCAFAPTIKGTSCTFAFNTVSLTITVQGTNHSLVYNVQQGGAISVDAAATGCTILTTDGVVTDNSGGVNFILGRGKYPGSNTSAAAATGNLGQIINSEVLVGAAVSVSNNTATNVAFIDLPPGRWVVHGNVQTLPAGTTIQQRQIVWIHTTSATLPTAPGKGAYQDQFLTMAAGNGCAMATGTRILEVNSTTRVYLETFIGFTTSTMQAYGYIEAIRM